MAGPGRGAPPVGRRLLSRVGLTLFALLILVYWGIGLQFSFAYGLLSEAQQQQTLVNYLWELPAIGVPVAILLPLWLLRPVARDYDAMRRGEALPDPKASAARLLAFPRRIVLIFTPVSILAYLLGNIQTWYLYDLPIDEFLKGIPLGLPLGLLFSLGAYLAVSHFLDPVRRLFIERHGYDHAPKPMTSVYRKVVVSSVTIVTLGLALLWLIAYAHGQNLLEDQLHARMEERTLPEAVAIAMRPEDPLYAENLAEVGLGERGYAFIVDAGGAVTSAHPAGFAQLAEEGWDPVERAAILGGGLGRFTDRTSEVRLVAFTQVPGTSDHLVLVTYRDDFAAPLADMSYGMLVVTLLGLAVGLGLTLVGARAIAHPVQELTEAMGRAKDDGTGGGIHLITDDEVGLLAASYARMMARLRDKTRALEDSVERLREMDLMKTRFMNIASHELRTPMTPIRTELHLIMKGRRGPVTPEQMRGLELVSRNVDRLNRLIREMLEASRMEAGQLRLNIARRDVRGAALQAVDLMESEAKARDIGLVFEAPHPVWTLADDDRVQQVLINLLENALQFTPAGGKVTVQVEQRDGMALVSVQDTGAGIEPQVIARLFQPFSQAEPGVPRTEGGTGLGLFICRGIIEAHGGRIWCESAGKGQGATFRFTLPLAPAEPAPTPVDAFGKVERPEPAAGSEPTKQPPVL